MFSFVALWYWGLYYWWGFWVVDLYFTCWLFIGCFRFSVWILFWWLGMFAWCLSVLFVGFCLCIVTWVNCCFWCLCVGGLLDELVWIIFYYVVVLIMMFWCVGFSWFICLVTLVVWMVCVLVAWRLSGEECNNSVVNFLSFVFICAGLFVGWTWCFVCGLLCWVFWVYRLVVVVIMLISLISLSWRVCYCTLCLLFWYYVVAG